MKQQAPPISGVPGVTSKKKNRKIIQNWQLYLFILPTVLYFIIFKYIPMYGIQIAFKDYVPSLVRR